MGKYTPPQPLGNTSKKLYPKPLSGRKPLLLFMIALIAIGLLAGSIYIIKKSKEQANVKCSDSVLNAAGDALNPLQANESQLEQLKPVVENIKQIEGHEKDPNCLYILANHSVLMSDVQGAKTYLGKLNKAYNSKTGLSKEFGYNDPLPALRARIAVLEKRKQERTNNARTLLGL